MTVGDIQPVNIEQEMRNAYLDYAMSVIVSRALPDARDGLKPVHRRILYAMHDMGLRPSTAHKKSARIVGEVLGKYHPHGDSAVYDAMVRLAQDFSMRYMLVDGQGNFGSIDGDGAAAMRYTEARIANLGSELLIDIEKDTVDFTENFDGSLTEPSVLPANLPNLLINGASGIAVGMSTSIPPHNMGEVVDALVYMLSHWQHIDDITIDDLMQFIKGPDFPTGGVIYGHQETEDEENPLLQAYATGRGKITVRAKVHIEDMGRGKQRIIVSELPYQTNKTTLIERIATLVTSNKLEGLSDLRDESDRQNPVRLVIELQRGVEATDVLHNLFKLTPLQETFSIIMLALVENQPRLLTLKQALRVYLEHRIEIVRRRSEYDLARAKERAHILEGLLTALSNLDEVVAIIRKSRNVDTARTNLIKALSISEIQAQAILDMPLRRLAALERKKIEEEHKEKIKLINYLEGLLKDPKKVRILIAEELTTIKAEYNDPRRTIIANQTAAKVSASDFLMPEEATWITLTVDGKLGRLYSDEPPKVTASDKNPPRFIVESTTAQTLYLVTTKGDCATVPVQQLPQINAPEDGNSFYDLSTLTSSDEVAVAIALPANMSSGYLFFATEQAQVKRVRVEDLPGVSAKTFTIMKVADDDKLITGFVTMGEDSVLLTTAQAQTIRFSEDDVRPTGLPAGGMRGIKLLGQRDKLVGASRAVEGQYVWVITDDGIAKISHIDEYPVQGRAGSGVITMRMEKTSMGLAAATIGRQDDNIIALTNKNKPLYMRVGRAPQIKRGRTGGESVIALRNGEEVIGVVNYQSKITAPDTDA
ncbi:DNA gyrase subunit A [Phototrophicus methaneseepsis]|uniref:DNA topoisomerase (ATP-hydrolyzing) n=1 Tax=Phototrophicus methaneseepsis TaxID=2710758 RepID=A0A7S8E6T5_9CHLR|nr:DNA gyrase subunit A [Phototrophicus methaneseepsis]QPC81438.1 DNA gyrase subunit A [Phototrophicus methaneseepsis]